MLQGGVGKGDALTAGFAAATGDIIVAIDGDGSTDGAEIIRFVSVLLSGADFAKGSRFNSAGGSDDITPVRRYGNKFLNVAVNRLFGTSFSDLCYGYNAFWAHHLPKLGLDSPGFEIETLMSIRAAAGRTADLRGAESRAAAAARRQQPERGQGWLANRAADRQGEAGGKAPEDQQAEAVHGARPPRQV